LGFWLGEPFWNNGYVTEATGKVLQFGFEEIGLQKIFAIHLIDNPASGKVMIKNGMIKEGELVDHLKKGDKYHTVIQYRLTRDEFMNKQ
jgi:RimJ/RimL family protein N-acetyltransferase